MSPLCESYISPVQRNQVEPFYPLRVYVCSGCFLVQLEEYVDPDQIFSEYAYFSSYADSWLAHAKRYVEDVRERFALGAQSQVVEVASNDGYLLQYFVEQGVPVLGIEPAANIASVAEAKGVPTLNEFFGVASAERLVAAGKQADLLIGNNVLAHVPDINDFVGGIQRLLKADGVATLEFPHLVRLIEGNQFDTIYHEHFSYLSLVAVEQIFAAHGLTIFDVDALPTHGGSLRIYARHTGQAIAAETPAASERVQALRREEAAVGITTLAYYESFAEQVRETKRKLLEFLIEAKRAGKQVVGYGAPGKSATLLNYCGIRTDFVDYTVDRNPYKQGQFTPGVHLPICAPEKIRETQPDYVLILPWNFKDEIMQQMAYIREWGAQFVVPIPEVVVER